MNTQYQERRYLIRLCQLLVQTLKIVCCNRCTLTVVYCKNLSHLKQKENNFQAQGITIKLEFCQ
jgi:hypothetical protein